VPSIQRLVGVEPVSRLVVERSSLPVGGIPDSIRSNRGGARASETRRVRQFVVMGATKSR
jgi:hypothetical protein